MEIWKDIEGYEGLYQVSNFGNVKSKNGIRKTPINSSGYFIVKLCKHGKIKFFSVHRLVASAFLPNQENFPCVNHKDENKQNNHVDNLEWCTQKYNNEYSISIPIQQIDKTGVCLCEWNSIKQASETLHIDGSSIAKCCKQKRNTAGGFCWRYKKRSMKDHASNVI